MRFSHEYLQIQCPTRCTVLDVDEHRGSCSYVDYVERGKEKIFALVGQQLSVDRRSEADPKMIAIYADMSPRLPFLSVTQMY